MAYNSDNTKLEDLVDIRDVKIDRTLPQEERIKSFVQQIKNPYYFRVGDVKVRVEYASRKETLTEAFSAMLAML